MNTTPLAIFLSSAALSLAGCLAAPAKTASGDRVTHENAIAPLIEKQCGECHGKDSPNMEEFEQDKERYKKEKLGPRLDSYENLIVFVNGSDTGALMRRLDDGAHTKDGKPGNMHKKLGESDSERSANLALFKSWVGGWTLKRAKEITPEERAAILAPRN